MASNFESVWEFHETMGFATSRVPRIPVREERDIRLDLLREELAEFVEAERNGDLAAMAHEMADLLYVIYGMAVTYGIPMDEVFREVHAANMRKTPNGGAKPAKGPGYRKPDVQAILDAHANILK